jgi:hypothetical protein
LAVTFQNYLNALKSNTRDYLIKLEFLDANENVTSTLTPDLLDGKINIDLKNGSRRSATLTLQNKDLRFLPNPDGEIWLNTKIRIYTGIKVNGEEYYNSQGIFVLGEPESDSNFAEKTATLNLYDKFTMLDGTLGGELLNDIIINVNTKIEDAVKSIATEAGEIKSPLIEPTNETLPYTLILNAGQTYFDILNQLAKVLSWVVYYDRNGYLRFEPPSELDTAGSVWDFTDDTLYMGASKRLDYTKVKNKIRVVGDTIQGEIFDATAEDANLSSPTRTSLIGTRGKLIEDDIIYSASLAQQRADYELQQSISIYESVNANCVPIDFLDVDNVITITDASLGLNQTRYLVQSVSLPLKQNSSQQLNVWQIRNFS